MCSRLVGWKLRQKECRSLEAEFLLLEEPQVLFSKPLMDVMRPTRAVRGELLYLMAADCK